MPKSFEEQLERLKTENIFIKTVLADKFKVRLWVQKTLDESLSTVTFGTAPTRYLGDQTRGIDYIVPLIGKWDKVEDVDFDLLPYNCMLKANHGCNLNVVFTKHTDNLQLLEIKEKLRQWMTVDHSTVWDEMQYKAIPRCIIAEELLRKKAEYKVYCFGGVPKYILVLDWFRGREHQTIYDADFNLKQSCTLEHLPVLLENHPERNVNVEKLKYLAATLSNPFRFVRVDFLATSDKIYFNEMTFTPAGMNLHLTPDEFKAEVEAQFSNLFTSKTI